MIWIAIVGALLVAAGIPAPGLAGLLLSLSGIGVCVYVLVQSRKSGGRR